MWRKRALPLLWSLMGFTTVAGLVEHHLIAASAASPQAAQPAESLHGVLSRHALSPPLRDATVTLLYSPDGRYLMVQNTSGVYLFSREPLRLIAYFSADDIYPVQFSADSKTIVSIGRGLMLTRANLPAGRKQEERELPFQNGCLQAEFAPGADYFACLAPSLTLVVLRLSTSEPVFSDSMQGMFSPNGVFHIPLDPDNAFPGPFGFRLANNLDSLVDKGMSFLSMSFSQDGNTLLVKNEWEAFSVDLTTRRKTSLAGSLQKRLHGSFSLQSDERVLIASGEKESGPAIVSLKNGEVLAKPAFKADAVRLASNPRYALLSDVDAAGVRLFDLEGDRAINVPDNLSIDVFGNEMAVLNESGSLTRYRIGESRPLLSVDLPLNSLPVLRAAAVSPTLDRLAFSVDGNSAVSQVENGERSYTGPRFSAANFLDQASAYLLFPRDHSYPPRVVQLALASGTTTPIWTGGKDHLRSGGTVLLEYELVTQIRHRFAATQENDVSYRLRARDPASGSELWKREFVENSPVPFADPQGERVVLAWNAKSSGAEEAARRIPSVWESFKRAKRVNLDSFFEILDARSGKTLGGVLVQQGSGPYSYDAAFSVGDALFLMKDGKRVSVYSLHDGSLKARFVGGFPTASAQMNLFAIEEGPGRLFLYDLATTAKLDQQIFSDSIAYIHFSADGNRLLVLTKHQVAYVFDVSGVRSAPKSVAQSPSQ
jgi:hypothetical protein